MSGPKEPSVQELARALGGERDRAEQAEAACESLRAHVRKIQGYIEDFDRGRSDLGITLSRISMECGFAMPNPPAPGPRDFERLLESVDVSAYYRVLPLQSQGHSEPDGWYIDVDPPHGAFRTREEAIAHRDRHFAMIARAVADVSDQRKAGGR